MFLSDSEFWCFISFSNNYCYYLRHGLINFKIVQNSDVIVKKTKRRHIARLLQILGGRAIIYKMIVVSEGKPTY